MVSADTGILFGVYFAYWFYFYFHARVAGSVDRSPEDDQASGFCDEKAMQAAWKRT